MLRFVALLAALACANAQLASFSESVLLTTEALINGENMGVVDGGFELNLVDGDEPETSGTARVFYDDRNQRIWWQIEVEDLADDVNITQAHFHLGGVNETGPVEIFIAPATAAEVGITEIVSPFSGRFNIDDTMRDNLLAGNWYINVHTSTNPATGEIRGQVLAEESPVFQTTILLTTEAELAGLADGAVLADDVSASMGRAELLFNINTLELCWGLAYNNLSSPTSAAHFHGPADVDATAGVLITISSGTFEDPHVGCDTVDDANVLDMLYNDMWYINLHTDNNPATGELRGQVTDFELADPARVTSDPDADDNGSFCESVTLTTEAVTLGSPERREPVNAADSTGIAAITYDGVTSTLWWRIEATTGSAVTAAHFHVGGPDEEGGVDVTIDINGTVEVVDNLFNTVFAGSMMLDATMYPTLVDGGYYVNIHTTDNAAGEIRGQVLAVEGPVYRTTLSLTTEALLLGERGAEGVTELEGDTEDASGWALVLYTESTLQLCWVITTDSLSSDTTVAHFHGPASSEGTAGVAQLISDEMLTIPHVGNLVITAAEGTELLDNEQWYLNVHTTENPATGEVRAQVDQLVLLTPQAVDPDATLAPVDDDGEGGASTMVASSMALVVASAIAFFQS